MSAAPNGAADLWNEFPEHDRPSKLPSGDLCFYARVYGSGKGYTGGQGNDLISNLKKHPSRKGLPEWYYKEQAIRRFARELAGLIPKEGVRVVTMLPPSKAPTHVEYDSRLDDVAAQLAGLRPDLLVERPFEVVSSRPAQHHLPGRCSSEDILATLNWIGYSEPTDHVVLVDDVVTSGNTYLTVRGYIRQNLGQPDLTTYGVFWARATRS